jgi:hypothetical protein
MLALLGNEALGEPCITDIRQAFDTMAVNGRADVCVLDRGPWTGTFKIYVGTGSGIFNGSLLSLFSFRPDGFQTGEANDLQIKLKQVSIHVWKVAFERDGTEVPESKPGRETVYVWARDTMAIPEVFGTMGETEARLFYCRTDGASACRTTYKVPICRSYVSDVPSRIAMGPESPELILFAESDLPPERLLQTFGLTNDKVDALLQTLMEHSCRR